MNFLKKCEAAAFYIQKTAQTNIWNRNNGQLKNIERIVCETGAYPDVGSGCGVGLGVEWGWCGVQCGWSAVGVG